MLLQWQVGRESIRKAAEPVHTPAVSPGNVLPAGHPVHQLQADHQVMGLVALLLLVGQVADHAGERAAEGPELVVGERVGRSRFNGQRRAFRRHAVR